MLGNTRVLDLTDGRGAFAGLLLAQMGADVVLVEPPEGLESRRRPPFVDDLAGPEQSLVHHGYNRGKRSVVLDHRTDEGRAAFADLVRGADVVIETGGPAERRALGRLDWADLQVLNPGIVHGVLSPFGSTGPRADWMGSDLVVGAAGAQLAITGNPDAPPLRTAVPQTWLHASADLAIGVVLALHERRRSGCGQAVDIAAAHSWIDAAFHYPLFAAWGQPDPIRNGSHVRIGPVGSVFDFPAKDGHVTLTLLFGAAVGPFTTRFVQWMAEEGACDPSFGEIDYAAYDPGADIEHFEALKAAITAFTSSKTKAELDAAAWERRLLVAPVHGLTEVLANEHFVERGVFRPVEVGDGHDAIAPGPIAIATPTPLTELTSAPALGAHTQEVLAQLGASAETSPAPNEPAPSTRPLDGVKVLDLTISFAGPIIGRILAAHGATVVKVESEQRPDLTRTAGVFMGGDTIDHSGCFATYNANKLSMGMNLTKPGARDVLFDLVAWADVLVCSFAPGALDRMGLDPETRRALNPSLITMQSSLLGQTGPLSGLAGYGNMAAAVCGFFATTGWPGRTPVGPMGAYTDIISPRFAAALIIAALDHLDRTGEPTDFDLGQGESCLHLLTLGMLDTQVNARSWERMGNRDHFNAPHGVFPAAGDDEWIALAVASDDEWCRLVEHVGDPTLAAMAPSDRFTMCDEVERLIADWSSGHDAEHMAAELQSLGIAAHQVQNGSHLRSDPQMAHRGWCVEAGHDRIGPVMVNTSPIELSRTPATFETAGPPLGQHTFEVLTDLLGYDPDRIAELAVAEVLE